MTFVYLTDQQNGLKIRVNMAMIALYVEDARIGAGSIVDLNNSIRIWVKETPEEIDETIALNEVQS